MSRKICYVTGTRADFGLMQSTLQAIHQSDEFELSIIVTGMHLAEQYGNTVDEITDCPDRAIGKLHLLDSIGGDRIASERKGRDDGDRLEKRLNCETIRGAVHRECKVISHTRD